MMNKINKTYIFRNWAATSSTLIALLVLPLVLASFDANASTLPESDNPKSQDSGTYKRQEEMLLVISNEIASIVDPTEGADFVTADGRDYGFSGMSIDPQHSTLDIYWVGDLPGNIRTVVESADGAINIKVHRSKFTLFEMEEAALGLLKKSAAKSLGIDASFWIAGPRTDGEGVDAEFIVNDPDEAGYLNSESVSATLNRSSTVPVFALQVSRPGNNLASRQLDQSPFAGGAGYTTPNSYCSTGFGVKSLSTANEYLLSAYHCFYGGPSTISISKPDNAAVWGLWKNFATRNAPSYDASLILPNSGNAAAEIYNGSYSSNNRGGVSGAEFNTVGESLCVSGANSGAHCGVVVISKNNYVAVGSGGTILQSVVRGGSQSGAVIAVSGDSGGPVYFLGSNGRSARGLVSQGLGQFSASCNSTPTYTPKDDVSCYSQILWTGIVATLDDLNMTILTQ